jgi:outer membrane murein-binding lipoprotein Lpp
MNRLVCLILSALLAAGCFSESKTQQVSQRWDEVVKSPSASAEKNRLESFVQYVRSAHLGLTVSILDSAGRALPGSQWQDMKKLPLEIEIRVATLANVLRWHPQDRQNVAILFQE